MTSKAFAGLVAACMVAFAGALLATGHQAQQRANAAISTPIIRSESNLGAYLRMTARSGSPLDYLTPPARERFLAGLSFGPGGITGFRFDDLQAELTPTQIYQILSLFGAQRDTVLIKGARILTPEDQALMNGPPPPDHALYECITNPPHNCEFNIHFICLSSC